MFARGVFDRNAANLCLIALVYLPFHTKPILSSRRLRSLFIFFLSTSALNWSPNGQDGHLAFDVESGHVAMTFAGFERFESLKCLFPPPIAVRLHTNPI